MGLVNHNGFNVTEHGESIAWWKDDSPYANFVPGDAIPSFRVVDYDEVELDPNLPRIRISTAEGEYVG